MPGADAFGSADDAAEPAITQPSVPVRRDSLAAAAAAATAVKTAATGVRFADPAGQGSVPVKQSLRGSGSGSDSGKQLQEEAAPRNTAAVAVPELCLDLDLGPESDVTQRDQGELRQGDPGFKTMRCKSCTVWRVGVAPYLHFACTMLCSVPCCIWETQLVILSGSNLLA